MAEPITSGEWDRVRAKLNTERSHASKVEHQLEIAASVLDGFLAESVADSLQPDPEDREARADGD